MRILLVHNYYRSGVPSGENAAFERERELLERHGHEVRTFTRRSDELVARGGWGALQGAMATPWNPFSARALRHAVDAFRPDVVHAHNTFPLLSPSIFRAVRGRAARVVTLHNYRLLCPAAVPLRDGRTCTECLDRRSVLPSLRHGCYRGSRLATVPLAANVALARALSTWQRDVEAFIALTEFQRDMVIRAGLPAERVVVKPQFHLGSPSVVPWAERRQVAVYAGRLSEEKGVHHLLEAWIAWGAAAPELRIAGEGPLRLPLRERARAAAPGRVTFLGPLSPDATEREIATARLLLVPSICLEGFPMVLLEALALGTPAAVSGLGALPEIVEGGRAGPVFRAGDAGALLESVRAAWSDPGLLERMGSVARRTFEARYTEDENHRALVEIYRRAMTST